MAQSSWPITDFNLSDLDWRDSHGQEPGVTGDLDGSAYRVTLPTDSDVALVGSSTQQSTAQVAGFGHRIPAGETEAVTIPAATGAVRTDIIALRYDPAHTGQPGPVRLVRLAGTSAGLPAYDDDPPGAEDLPLWSVTRQPGQALSQATVRRLFPYLAALLDVPGGAPLPTSAPLATVARQGDVIYRRVLDAAQVPTWKQQGYGRPTTLRDPGRQGNHLRTGGESQAFGSSSSGRLRIPVGAKDRLVRIDCDVEVFCPQSLPTAGTVRLYANGVELLPNPDDWGTFHNRTGVGYGPRPANAHVRWEGVLSDSEHNIWLNVAADPNSQEVWITGFDLTVVYR